MTPVIAVGMRGPGARPEGMISSGNSATALVAVTLAALAVGLGLAKRSWPIGAGLGGASILVGLLGCCGARRSIVGSVAVPGRPATSRVPAPALPAPLQVGAHTISVRVGSVKELIDNPWEAPAIVRVQRPDESHQDGTVEKGWRMRGAQALITVWRARDSNLPVADLYRQALGQVGPSGNQIAVRYFGPRTRENANTVIQTIREDLRQRQPSWVKTVQLFVKPRQLRHVAAAIEAQRGAP
jgi:hypothetical protein